MPGAGASVWGFNPRLRIDLLPWRKVTNLRQWLTFRSTYSKVSGNK
jgi:hypothetical protein